MFGELAVCLTCKTSTQIAKILQFAYLLSILWMNLSATLGVLASVWLLETLLLDHVASPLSLHQVAMGSAWRIGSTASLLITSESWSSTGARTELASSPSSDSTSSTSMPEASSAS